MVKHILNSIKNALKGEREMKQLSRVVDVTTLPAYKSPPPAPERPKREWLTFNINNYVKVRLTDKGYQLLADDHNRFLNLIPQYEYITLEHYKLKADKNGYTLFHAWHFIQIFGSVTKVSGQQFYDSEILIEKNGN